MAIKDFGIAEDGIDGVRRTGGHLVPGFWISSCLNGGEKPRELVSERSLKSGIVVAIFITTFPFAEVLGFSRFVLKRDFFVAFEEQSKSLAVAVDRALECGQRDAMAALDGLIGGLLNGFKSI